MVIENKKKTYLLVISFPVSEDPGLPLFVLRGTGSNFSIVIVSLYVRHASTRVWHAKMTASDRMLDIAALPNGDLSPSEQKKKTLLLGIAVM